MRIHLLVLSLFVLSVSNSRAESSVESNRRLQNIPGRQPVGLPVGQPERPTFFDGAATPAPTLFDDDGDDDDEKDDPDTDFLGGDNDNTPAPTPVDDDDEGTPAPTPFDDDSEGTPAPSSVDDVDDEGTPAPTNADDDDQGTSSPTPGDDDDDDEGTPSPTPGDDDDDEGTPSPTSLDDAGEATPGPTPGDAGDGEDFSTPTRRPASSPTFPTRAPSSEFGPSGPSYPTFDPPVITPRPTTEYIGTDDDPLQPDTPFQDDDTWQWTDSTIEEMEHDRSVIVALSVVFGFGICLAIITAHQLLDNPDGICASICRIMASCTCAITRCVCYPCRAVCGCTGRDRDRRTHDIMMQDEDHYTHDLELS